MASGSVAVNEVEHHELLSELFGNLRTYRSNQRLQVVPVGTSGEIIALKKRTPRRLNGIGVLDVLLVEFIQVGDVGAAEKRKAIHNA
jgi:hypothetical protein